MSVLACLAGLALGLWVVATPALGIAQTAGQGTTAAAVPATGDPTQSPAYKALIEEAVREYAAQNFPEARSLFTRAYALSPNARVLRGLGMSEFELRNYPRSVDFLRRALASTDHPLDGNLRSSAEALLLRAERFVIAVPLSIVPANATLLVDGQPATRTADGALVLQVGDHTLEFAAAGYRPQRRTLSVTGENPTPIEVVLEATNLAVTGDAAGPATDATPGPTAAELVAPGPQADKDEDGSLLESPFLWAGVGVGAAVITVVLIATLSGGEVRDPIADDPAITLAGP